MYCETTTTLPPHAHRIRENIFQHPFPGSISLHSSHLSAPPLLSPQVTVLVLSMRQQVMQVSGSVFPLLYCSPLTCVTVTSSVGPPVHMLVVCYSPTRSHFCFSDLGIPSFALSFSVHISPSFSASLLLSLTLILLILLFFFSLHFSLCSFTLSILRPPWCFCPCSHHKNLNTLKILKQTNKQENIYIYLHICLQLTH